MSVGVVGSGLKKVENRPMFNTGLMKLVELKSPTTLVVVGSAGYPIFDEIRARGVAVVQFDGEACKRFKGKGCCHV